MHVKKGDKVVVTAGKDRGESGEVLEVDVAKNRVKVERRNMVVKHKRPNPITGAEGQRMEIEGWIHASNVSLYSKELDGPTRTRTKFVGKGGELFDDQNSAAATLDGGKVRRVRVGVKTGELFDSID